MKKILTVIAVIALLMGTISCNDEPKRGDGVFTVNTLMVNHIVNINNGTVLGIANTHNRLTLDTVNHKASLELRYNDGSDKTASLSDIKATAKRYGFYELTATGNAQVKDFKGYVDFNEGAMRYTYTTTDGIRVISTIPQVFFLKTHNKITYNDTTKPTSMENVMYQFEIMPANQTAVVKVMDIVHAKDVKHFYNITASSVPMTITPNGYSFSGQNINTIATYRSWTDSIGTPKTTTTDAYPFKTFSATVDLVNDTLVTNFMMGPSATVAASGRTYPNYTAY